VQPRLERAHPQAVAALRRGLEIAQRAAHLAHEDRKRSFAAPSIRRAFQRAHSSQQREYAIAMNARSRWPISGCERKNAVSPLSAGVSNRRTRSIAAASAATSPARTVIGRSSSGTSPRAARCSTRERGVQIAWRDVARARQRQVGAAIDRGVLVDANAVEHDFIVPRDVLDTRIFTAM
jgi:hypothetical protein